MSNLPPPAPYGGKYVATYTVSSQVTEDSYRIFDNHLECTPETTLADILRWKDSLGRGCTPISLTITKLEQLP